VAVFNNSTHAQVDTGSFGSVSYPVGHTVRESIYYNTGNGDMTFTVQDITSSMAATTNTVKMNVGTGVAFTEVRIGSEFGITPWTAPARFTKPANGEQKVAQFTNGTLTNYRGQRYGLAGYWNSGPLVMAGPEGSEGGPDSILHNGFPTYIF
jgi:hypothetical protein